MELVSEAEPSPPLKRLTRSAKRATPSTTVASTIKARAPAVVRSIGCGATGIWVRARRAPHRSQWRFSGSLALPHDTHAMVVCGLTWRAWRGGWVRRGCGSPFFSGPPSRPNGSNRLSNDSIESSSSMRCVPGRLSWRRIVPRIPNSSRSAREKGFRTTAYDAVVPHGADLPSPSPPSRRRCPHRRAMDHIGHAARSRHADCDLPRRRASCRSSSITSALR